MASALQRASHPAFSKAFGEHNEILIGAVQGAHHVGATMRFGLYALVYLVGFTACWTNGLALGAKYGRRCVERIAVGGVKR